MVEGPRATTAPDTAGSDAPRASARAGRDGDRRFPFAAYGAVLFFVFVALDVALGLLASQKGLSQDLLPWPARIAAYSLNAVLVAGVVAALLAVVVFARWAFWRLKGLLQRPAPRLAELGIAKRLAPGFSKVFPPGGLVDTLRRLLHRTVREPGCRLARLLGSPRALGLWARAARFLALLVLLFFYLASWAGLYHTGEFPGRQGLAYWAQSPIQLLLHVAHLAPVLYLGVPAASVLAAAVLAELVPRLLRVASARFRRRLVLGAATVVALLGLFAAVGQARWAGSATVVHADSSDASVTIGDLYVLIRDRKGGPLSHALSEARFELSPRTGRLPVDRSIPVVRRPIISMRRYLEGVPRAEVRRFNVIVLLVESLRFDHLAAFGEERGVMPNLDAVAARGRVYTNAYTQASHSDYADPCALSSHYPLRRPGGGVYEDDPSYPRVFIYDVLKALGWRTSLISSQNENWGNMLAYLDTGNLDYVLHSETFEGPTYVPRTDTFQDWIQGTKRAGKIDDRFTIQEAIDWIDNEEPPFFMYMNLQNSHVPYELPADYERRFSKNDSFEFTFARLEQDEIPLAKALYADALGYVDQQIGRLVDHLKERGIWDRTILVVSGDTGQGFMEHGFFTHARDLYNEVMRVPIIVRAPGLTPASDDRVAEHVDVPPTVFELLGLPPHPSFQGTSLLSGAPDERAFMMVRTAFAHQYAIVRRNLKLIYDRWTDDMELYDLASDPGETTDLSSLRPLTVRSLATELGTWRLVQFEYYSDEERQQREYPPVLDLP